MRERDSARRMMMHTKRTMLLLCLAASIPLLACTLFPGGTGARATQAAATSQAVAAAEETGIAATVYAVQTAEAPTPTRTATVTPTLTPTYTPTPTQTPTPGPLSATEVLARVSPAIVFIDTPAGTASGILIEDGYIVTNAHAVWPFRRVRVVFSDGLERLNAPVLGWDLMADVAVIGPLHRTQGAVALVDREDLVIGSGVFQIGFPAEMEEYPQPSISRGVVSRMREWKPIGMTFFQTDAATVGGQSGGALVSEMGEVIGISAYRFSDQFGLAASAADVLPRVQGLIAGDDVSGLGDRSIPAAPGQIKHDIVLANYWAARMFVINELAGTRVQVTVDGENDARFGIFDVRGGALTYVDDGFTGSESGSVTTNLRAPYFLVVEQLSTTQGRFGVRSNCTLASYDDRDDGITVSLNQTISASIDYPFDVDYYSIVLGAGDTVDVVVDSLLIDPAVTIDFPGATEEQVITDDDRGGGLFGLSAKVTYRAPHSGRYYIVVQDSWMSRVGGYILTVTEAPRGATAVSPPPAPTRIASPVGPMVLYESADKLFSIQYPADWTETSPMLGETARFVSPQNGMLSIVEEDLTTLGMGDMTLEEYVDMVVTFQTSILTDLQIVSREHVTTEQGLPAVTITYTYLGGLFQAGRLIYLTDDGIAFNATYLGTRARYEELAPLAEYSFSSFQVAVAE
jgi:S1-C subfamily serine protease